MRLSNFLRMSLLLDSQALTGYWYQPISRLSNLLYLNLCQIFKLQNSRRPPLVLDLEFTLEATYIGSLSKLKCFGNDISKYRGCKAKNDDKFATP